MKKSKFLCWRSYSRLTFEECVVSHKSLTVEEVAVILSIYQVYAACFDWAAFQLLRIGDGKYTFIFQRLANGVNTVKVTVS